MVKLCALFTVGVVGILENQPGAHQMRVELISGRPLRTL